jgi:hypothetical protein
MHYSPSGVFFYQLTSMIYSLTASSSAAVILISIHSSTSVLLMSLIAYASDSHVNAQLVSLSDIQLSGLSFIEVL